MVLIWVDLEEFGDLGDLKDLRAQKLVQFWERVEEYIPIFPMY